MTQQQIQQLFQQRYNQNNWKQFLGQAFADTRLLSTPLPPSFTKPLRCPTLKGCNIIDRFFKRAKYNLLFHPCQDIFRFIRN